MKHETATAVNQKRLRENLKREGISLTRLAKRFGCSREAIYFALERPSRFPEVYRKIIRFCESH